MALTQINVHNREFVSYIAEDQIKQRVCEMAGQLSEKYKDADPLFICILNGSFIFASDFYREIPYNAEIIFTKLKSYDGTESTGTIKEELGLGVDIENRTIVILEDIVDTGRTLKYFVGRLKEKNPAEVVTVSLLFKPEAFKEDYKLDYVGFEIPDKFVVGYGLDYDGLGRNYKDIYQLK